MRAVTVITTNNSADLGERINAIIKDVEENDGYILSIHYSTAATNHYVYHSALVEHGHDSDDPLGTQRTSWAE